MKIYEGGRSIALAQLGFPVINKTYICVLETDEDVTIEKGLQLIVEEVSSKGLEIVSVVNETVTVKGGDTYTISHEIISGNGTTLKRVSNILRHCFTRNLCIDTLYIDENNQICDLTNTGIQSIQNGDLNTPLKNEEALNRGVNFLIDVLDAAIKYRLRFHDSIYIYFDTINLNNLEPVDNNNKIIANLITNYSKQFIKLLEGYHILNTYFYNKCGLGYTIDFSPERIKPIEVSKNIDKVNSVKFIKNSKYEMNNFVGSPVGNSYDYQSAIDTLNKKIKEEALRNISEKRSPLKHYINLVK